VERPEARAVIAQRCKDLDARLVEVDAMWRVEELQAADGAIEPSRKRLIRKTDCD